TGTQAEYQITVEAIDPLLSQLVGPYQPSQVRPSGTARPFTVVIGKGGEVQQDILMLNSATEIPDRFDPQSLSNPAPVPTGADWIGSLSGYGDSDYFRFTGKANRTLSVEVTALDETSVPSQDKALPVIGLWPLASTAVPAPAATPGPFNTVTIGTSQL